MLRVIVTDRSSFGLVHSSIDVKSWIEELPSVEAARPARCPLCGAASRRPGRSLGLHGHGTRPRGLWRALALAAPTVVGEILVRRYLCQLCDRSVTVVPRGVLWRRLYGATAIATALALWAVERQPAPQVRTTVSPWPLVGATAAVGWCSLLRWSAAIRAGRLFGQVRASPSSWSARQVARRAVETLVALSPSRLRTESMVVRAAAGAERAR